MSKKQLPPTIAERAKAVIDKYRKRLGDNYDNYDPIAMASMNRELEELEREQEAIKAAQRQEVMQKQMALGGVLPMLWAGGTPDDKNFNLKGQPGVSYVMTPEGIKALITSGTFGPGTHIGGGNFDVVPSNTGNMWPPVDNTPPEIQAMQGAYGRSQVAGPPAPTSDGMTQYNLPPAGNWWEELPSESKVSMIAQLAGTLGSGIAMQFAPKPQQTQTPDTPLPAFNPSYYDEERRQLRNQLTDTMRSVRAYNPSAYGAMSATGSNAYQSGLAKISAEEQRVNAQGLNDFNMKKAGIVQNDLNRRATLDQRYNEMLNEWSAGKTNALASMIAGLGTSTAGVMKDAKQYQIQEDTMKYLSQGNYQRIPIGKGRSVVANTPGAGLMSFFDEKTGQMVYSFGDGQFYTGAEAAKQYEARLNDYRSKFVTPKPVAKR